MHPQLAEENYLLLLLSLLLLSLLLLFIIIIILILLLLSSAKAQHLTCWRNIWLVPNLFIGRTVFRKHQVNSNMVCGAIQDVPWRTIWSAYNPVEVLNEHLSRLVCLWSNQDHPCERHG